MSDPDSEAGTSTASTAEPDILEEVDRAITRLEGHADAEVRAAVN